MKNSILSEVVIVRLCLILTLVFYHAFAIYSGAWIREYTPPRILLYDWLDRLSYACMLESFVFISGYLVGYQVLIKKRELIIMNKVTRLLVPSILFSLIYWLIFNYNGIVSETFFYDLVNGVGHMWFLPMLFWCFVFLKLLIPLTTKHSNSVVILSFVMTMLTPLPLPFRLNLSFYYFPFFLIGYMVWVKEWYNLKPSIKIFIGTSLLFLFLFFFLTIVNKQIAIYYGNVTWMQKIIHFVSQYISKMIYSSVGVLLLFQIMLLFKTRINNLPMCLIRLSECCFGVYLLQQFFLVYMYDKTDLSLYVNPYLLPWLIFFIALICSVAGSWIIRQTRIGRYLI